MKRVAIAAAVLVFLWTHIAKATTVMPMEADSLVDQAELIFTGTALKSEVAVNPWTNLPYTLVTFGVSDILKGVVNGKQFTLQFTGGAASGEVVEVVGMPQFTLGEQYLLFVRGNGSSTCPLLGWWQGQFRFEKDAQGQSKLVDHAGVPIRGVAQNHWLRAAQKEKGDSGVRLLQVEGVRISPVLSGHSAKAQAEVPSADVVLGSLKMFVSSRAKSPTFIPGQFVRSISGKAWSPASGQGSVSAPNLN
jgi:hypothetical protein